MKRKHFSIILAVIMAFVIMAPTLISQKAFAKGNPATITKVTITPETAIVGKGKTQQFTAVVEGTGHFTKTVEWEVQPRDGGSSIDANGLLTVAENETAERLLVIATADGDQMQQDIAEVTVKENAPVVTPTVTGITVTPKTATVGKGKTQQFTARVKGTGDFDKTVTWSVIGGGQGTSIDENGLLTVAKDETAKTLTVRATSNADNKPFGEATVTVKEKTPPSGGGSSTGTEWFTITIDPNGGNVGGDTTAKVYRVRGGDYFTLPDAPVREGYQFLYWQGSRYQPGDRYQVFSSHTFTAMWEKDEKKPEEKPSVDSKIKTPRGSALTAEEIAKILAGSKKVVPAIPRAGVGK